MISVFDIFKIIMGIIISVFILFLLLRFSESYTQIGESSRQASVMINLKKALSDVYTTGIETDFETKENELIIGYRPPQIETNVAFVDIDPIPLLLIPGEKLSLYRNEYDLRWWKFYFVEALPETNILFIPLSKDEKIFSLMENITYYLPSTENTKFKTKFGLGCNGSDYWFGWEKQKFLYYILPKLKTYDLDFNLCENVDYFKNKNFKVLVISEDLAKASGWEIIIKPVDENVGYLYIKNEGGYKEYIYKNGIDIVSLILGGEEVYNYMNKKFFGELEVAIDVYSREVPLLLSDNYFAERCKIKLYEFLNTLNMIKDLIGNFEKQVREQDVLEFSQYMKESKNKYRELEVIGCA